MKRTLITIAIVTAAFLLAVVFILSQAEDRPDPSGGTARDVPADAPARPDATPAADPIGQIETEADPDAAPGAEVTGQADPLANGADRASRPTDPADGTAVPDDAEQAEQTKPADRADRADARQAMPDDASAAGNDADDAEAASDDRQYRVKPAPLGSQPEPVIGAPLRPSGEHTYRLQAKFSSLSAGLIHLKLAPYSTDAVNYDAYPLQSRVYWKTNEAQQRVHLYPMGSGEIRINGQSIRLTHANWRVVEDHFPMPGEPDADQPRGDRVTFQLTIVDDRDQPVLKITRQYRIEPDAYNLFLDQRIENLTDRDLRVQFVQLGQGDLKKETGYLGDMRRLAVGHYIPNYKPSVYTHDYEIPRGDLIPEGVNHPIWPTEDSEQRDLEMVWSGLVNRYFTATLHARTQMRNGEMVRPVPPLESLFPAARSYAFGSGDSARLLLMYYSRPVIVSPGSDNAVSLDVTLYGGPMDTNILTEPRYAGLEMERLIRYQTGCCLSFDWLSKLLYQLLGFFHMILLDWALAIMALVVIIRLLLHPITKRSQLNMMKFSRQMSKLQPEIEKIKKKHKDDPSKLNQEMMALYRERGVNPAAMAGGCLPMFLQTPIWIGLWAMLYFAFDLRHESAFFGVFQQISGGDWRFLSDLSTDDKFLMLPEAARFTMPFLGGIDSINLIPFLLVIVFYLQQKFMQPPTTGTMTEQQRTQQKMMRIMIMIFPFMLYTAPSGLTLYMVASTASGILDGVIVRRHLKELEDKGELDKPAPKKEPKPGGFMDRIQKAAEEKRKEAERLQKKQQQQQVPKSKRRSKRK